MSTAHQRKRNLSALHDISRRLSLEDPAIEPFTFPFHHHTRTSFLNCRSRRAVLVGWAILVSTDLILTIGNETAMVKFSPGFRKRRTRNRVQGRTERRLSKHSLSQTRLVSCGLTFWCLSVWLAPTSMELLLYFSQDCIPSQEMTKPLFGVLMNGLSETKYTLTRRSLR